MKKITPFLLSTVFLSKTLASKAQHRVVRIALFLIVFSCFSSYAIAGIQEKRGIPKMVQRSELIIRGKVISTESQWKEDSRGRHIYTNVTVKILDKIKGNIKDDAFAFEVVGGTVDDIREVVSNTPVFEIDEDAIVFLAGYPLAIQLMSNGKILIYDGRVYWDGSEVTADSFIRALKILEQDPNAPISLGEKYQAPTAEATAVPIITSISFDEAPADTNAQVTITGTNFGSTQGYSKVEFFNKSRQQKIPASIVSWSNTQIICTVPANISAGSSPVTVTTSDGTSSGYVIAAAECFVYSGYKWPGTSPVVPYYINENTSDCSGEGAAVQRGANTWNNVGANFTLQYDGSCSSTGANQDYVNCITWGTVSSGALAETAIWYYVSTKEIFECDIVFNDPDYTWSTKSTPYSWEYDVESVAIHEFGHWLSLDDLYDYADRYEIMYGYLSNGEVKRVLRQCDIDGICYIYGCPSCSITVTSPTGSSNWATGVSHSIEWDSSNNPGSYVKIELYKGSSLIETITSSTYDDGSYSWTPSLSLADGSDYRIKISATTDSSCYDYSSYFDLYTPCSITVTSPTGSSNWATGVPHSIEWDSSGNPDNYVKIELYKGSSLIETITSSTYDDGSYSWTPSLSLADGSDYRIKISATTDSSCYDYSSYFDLYTPCSITITSPDGGCWEVGEVHDINWISEYTSGDVKIELYKGGSLERVIEESWPDSGSYDWPIPDDDSLTSDCDYRIKVTDVLSSSCYDYSAYFCIATPPQAQDISISMTVDELATITLGATDEGCPDPPAALTYIITSLPIYGGLNDPCAGPITDPCTTLVNNGNLVEYIPDTSYEGQDSFTFKANDGGVPPGGGDSNEATVSINVTACTFFDDFPSTTLDTNNWTETFGTPTVDGLAGNEPSPPYSLHLEYTDTVTSRVIDLSGYWSTQLDYSWKRTGTEPNDNLYVDYWDGNEWQPLQVLLDGADTNWEPNSVELPGGALHSEFRLRFWADCDSSSDEWYIDDVCIRQSCIEPPLLHAEPNTTQGLCNTIYWDAVPDANEYYAECANDVNFNNISADSGWIPDTNYAFCSLEPNQTYWYHVKTWAPFSLKTWLQTSQVDFETDTLTDTRATADGNVVLAGGAGTGTPTVTVDTVGDSSLNITTTYGYLNCFLVATETTLTQIEVYLGISTSVSIEFVVYEGGPLFSDSYNRIHSSTLASSGTGTKFYSSDPISVPLEAGKHYIIGAFWSSSVVMYYSSGHSSPSFGSHVGYGYYNGFPSPDTITKTSDSAYTFYHRYTTAQATGYASYGDIVSTAIDLPADGNWVVVDFNTTTQADTELTIDILPSAGSTPIPGYENVPSGADLSGIGDPTIRLRANLSTNDTNNTPVLHDWLATYTDPALACESDWSNEVHSTQSQCAAPAVTGWEIAATHGGIGELWCPIEYGYVEPRVCGISKLRVCFDQPMDTNAINPNVISIEGENNGTQPLPCSIEWDGNDCMIIILCSALPDQDTYIITVSSAVKSAAGCAIVEDSICVTALKGDVNGNRAVNAQDMLGIKPRAGQPVDCNNARYDINCSGGINAQDMLAVRPNAEHAAPECPAP